MNGESFAESIANSSAGFIANGFGLVCCLTPRSIIFQSWRDKFYFDWLLGPYKGQNFERKKKGSQGELIGWP